MYRRMICLAVLVFGIAGNALGQPTGEILWEFWYDIGGTNLASLRNDPRFPDSPDISELRSSIDSELDPGENYGCRALGYLYAPADGDYEFWVAGDDNCELWLSTNDDPGNATVVARVASYTAQYEWTKEPGQKSSTITLQAGKKYYIEALMKEGTGGDTLTVGWGGPTIGAGPVIIDGQYLSPWLGWSNAHICRRGWDGRTRMIRSRLTAPCFWIRGRALSGLREIRRSRTMYISARVSTK